MSYSAALMTLIIAPQATEIPQISFDGLETCARISEAEGRLTCYDREARILIVASQRKQVVVITREELKRTRRTLFGLPVPDLGIFGSSADGKDKTEQLTEIESTVTSARPSAYGRWTFTLADGGLWETTDASTTMFVRSGQKVSIKATAFAFRARFGNDSWVRVKRVR
jgi:hypothetical protein